MTRPLTVPLPTDTDLEQIAWKPTRQEFLLERLAEMKRQWDAEELAYYRRRCAELALEVEKCRAWLERERLREERLAAIQNYYVSEREKEAQAGDKSRREKCVRIDKEMKREAARAEKARLIMRGVYRGRA